MADENKTVEAKATDFDDTQMAQLREILAKLLAEMGIKPVGDADAESKEMAKDVEPETAEQAKAYESAGEVASEAKESASEAVEAITEIVARVDELEAKAEGMDAKMLKAIADRDSLASKLSGFVGSFDHALMTASKVAEYGVKKLGIPAAKGQERVALDAWMHGRTPDHKKSLYGMDSTSSSKSLANAWIKGE